MKNTNKSHTDKKSEKSAFITGASSGIGRAFALHLASEGFNLIITARRVRLLAELADMLRKKYGIAVDILTLDLSTQTGIDTAYSLIAKKNIDMLVNCAGFGTRGNFVDVDPGKSGAMTVLHTQAALLLTRAVLPGMLKKNSGSIITISSLAAFFAAPQYVIYSATKAFLNMFTQGLHEELKGTGVRTMAVCPGLTRTGFMETGEYNDFDYSDIPSFAWMTADEVVSESMRALDRGKVIFIPGRGNRFFVWMMTAPLVGRLVKWIMGRVSTGKY